MLPLLITLQLPCFFGDHYCFSNTFCLFASLNWALLIFSFLFFFFFSLKGSSLGKSQVGVLRFRTAGLAKVGVGLIDACRKAVGGKSVKPSFPTA